MQKSANSHFEHLQ